MKSLVIIITFLGIIGITIGYVNQIKKCPPPTVEYRYIPRTFQEDQEHPIRISELYNAMFVEPTPWLHGMTLSKGDKNAEINRYYISQT